MKKFVVKCTNFFIASLSKVYISSSVPQSESCVPSGGHFLRSEGRDEVSRLEEVARLEEVGGVQDQPPTFFSYKLESRSRPAHEATVATECVKYMVLGPAAAECHVCLLHSSGCAHRKASADGIHCMLTAKSRYILYTVC
jgi:hypothetical protein